MRKPFRAGDVAGKLTTVALLAQLALAAPGGRAHAEGYLGGLRLDGARFLAPPPEDAARRAADLAAVKAWQGRPSAPRWRQAQADDDLSPFHAFDDVLGPDFTAARAPRTAALFEALFADVKAVTAPAKVAYSRPRPPRVDPAITPCEPLEQTGSYPSGHAARGWMMALVLSEMAPEKASELLARGRDYGDSRVVCAEHFPSDVEAGRLIGAAVAATVQLSPAYRRDFAAARVEVRRVLDLPPGG